MTVNSFFPIGTGGQFPDNGMLNNYAYDQRVTQNEMLATGMKLMHHGAPYETETDLAGNTIYRWNSDFIAMVDQSISDNVIANFSKEQGALFVNYLAFLADGTTSITRVDTVALNDYLTSRA